MLRHFVDLFDLTARRAPATLLDRAVELKREDQRGDRPLYLSGRTLGLIFEKPSLRTRVSFEAAIAQLGGNAIFLRGKDVGMGSRESVADFARVISQYVDALAVRTFSHATVEELARHATIPIINALSDARPPVPGAGRPADDPGGPRRARRASSSSSSATATTWRGRWPWPRPARASSSSWPPRRATSSRPTSARGSTRRSRTSP